MAAQASARACSWARWAPITRARVPSPSRAAWKSTRGSMGRDTAATRNPPWANRRATAMPMPGPAPRITARGLCMGGPPSAGSLILPRRLDRHHNGGRGGFRARSPCYHRKSNRTDATRFFPGDPHAHHPARPDPRRREGQAEEAPGGGLRQRRPHHRGRQRSPAKGIVDATLVGDEATITQPCAGTEARSAAVQIVHEPNDGKAAAKAVELVRSGHVPDPDEGPGQHRQVHEGHPEQGDRASWTPAPCSPTSPCWRTPATTSCWSAPTPPCSPTPT